MRIFMPWLILVLLASLTSANARDRKLELDDLRYEQNQQQYEIERLRREQQDAARALQLELDRQRIELESQRMNQIRRGYED
jgi:hypothetical protein